VRTELLGIKSTTGTTVLFGHWPTAEPRRGPKAIGLDTGCVYGGHLTAYIIETDEFVTVPATKSDAVRHQSELLLK
jgi:serine/threonine protein phosphatase 1